MATTGDVIRASSMLRHGELNVADTELKVPTGSIPQESTVIQMPPDPHADGLLKDDTNEATVSLQDPDVINQETDPLLGASRLEGQKQSELLSEAEVRNIMWIKMGLEGLKGVDGDKKHVSYKVALEHLEAKATVIQMPPDSQDPGVINTETSHQETGALLRASTPEGQKESELLSEAEIQNIMWIKMGPEGLKGVDGDKKHVLYKVALEHWEAKDKLFTMRVDKKMKQSLSVRNEIYQLIGFYSVFQGVLLTAVAQSNLLHCNNWWSVFTLSALASVVTVFGVKQKFDTILELEKTIGTEGFSRKVLYRCFLAMICTLLCAGALNPEPLLRKVGLDFHQTVHRVSLECIGSVWNALPIGNVCFHLL